MSAFASKPSDKDDKDDLIRIIGIFFSYENTNILSYITEYFTDDDFLEIINKHKSTLNNIKLDNHKPGINGVLDNHDLLIKLAEWFLLKKTKE
jgi:hypothetical protein